MSRKALVLSAALLVVLVPSLRGQGAADPPPGLDGKLASETGSFGADTQDFWVVASNFSGFVDWHHENLDYYVTESFIAAVQAPVDLPAGALVTRISCYFYDPDVTAGPNASVVLTRATYSNLTQTPTLAQIGGTIVSGTQNGYHVASQDFNETIRYRGGLTRSFYMLYGAMVPDVQFRGCRIEWKRQITAAPASATFSDVPTTHPYFRFVEALSASGITGGCGGGLYCVDAPITRGEMAVFLAVALGLHFPY